MKAKAIHYKQLLPAFLLLFSATIIGLPVRGLCQGFTVKGTVSGQGGPLPGVTIVEKGTSNGTTSSPSGNFQLSVSNSNAVLILRFLGYEPKEVNVSGKSIIHVILEASTEQLSNVVITALGIKRSERSLGYSVGTVSGQDINKANHTNFLTSLAGRVPGVSVSSTGGIGSSVSMVIRGATSLTGDNQPLFVVDGVPVNNSLDNVSEVGNRNDVDYGNAISDIDPNNIASISILKGPSAAALYGSRAGNGVVLITTKNGRKNKGIGVSVNISTVFNIPYKFLPSRTSLFAPGQFPYTPDNHPGSGPLTIDEGETNWVGPELNKGYNAVQWNSPVDQNGNPVATPLVSYPNNWENFMQTGITSTNNVALTNSNGKLSYRLSYTNMDNKGITPNTDLFRNNIALSSSYKITKNLTISEDFSFIKSNSNNRPASGRGTNPLNALAYLNPSVNIMDLKNYWVPGEENIQQLNFTNQQDNPWFLAYQAINSFDRNRIFGNINANWQINDHWDLTAMYGLDEYTQNTETHVAKSYTAEKNGIFGLGNSYRYERNTNFLLTYKNIFNNFSLNASAGGNLMYQKQTDLDISTNSAGIVIPGLYNLSNVLPTSLNYANYFSQKAIYSLYGIASLGYKEMVYLDVSGRNDWSSTLPVNNRSYFYPSASLSILLDQALHLPSSISMFKLRGGIAQAGKDADPYQISPVLNNEGAWGNQTQLSLPSTILNAQLKPEIKTSEEVGADLSFLNNRFRLSGTYYESNNKNQILNISIPYSSGYGTKLINAGLVKSRGIELQLGLTPLSPSSKWNWDININFSRNRTIVAELAEGLQNFVFWSDQKAYAMTYVGQQIGNMYGRKLVTVTDPKSPYYGWPILDNSGSWQDYGGGQNSAVKIGNYNPDFTMGLQTSLSYKNFTLSASFDWRNGGQFYSATYRYIESDLHSQRFLNTTIKYNGPEGGLPQFLKDHADQYIKNGIHIVGGPTKALGGLPYSQNGITLNDGVFNPGVIEITDANGNFVSYQENLGGPGTQYDFYADDYPWNFAQAALFSASYLKLTQISFSYELPQRFVKNLNLQSAAVSLYSSNILLWTQAKIGIDPEHAFEPDPSGDGFEQGIELYNVDPFLIPVGIKLSVDF